MPDQALDRRALNRATLARQHLLERAQTTAFTAIEHLVGMQGQAPDAPYVGLWSRLTDFGSAELAELILERRAVRISLMRATVHLVSARDALWLRPLTQGVLERSFASQQYARNLAGLDVQAVITAGRALLDEHPCSRAELGQRLAERFPDKDQASMSYAVSYLVPVVQVPPRGVWGCRGAAKLAPLDSWLGTPLNHGATLNELVIRYLAAYGPATVKDAQLWSGLTR